MPKLYPGGLALAPEVIGDRKDGQKHADTLFFTVRRLKLDR